MIDKSINDLKVYGDTSAYSERKRLSLAGFCSSLFCRQMYVNREEHDPSPHTLQGLTYGNGKYMTGLFTTLLHTNNIIYNGPFENIYSIHTETRTF
jgi:hypothetical protein